MSDLLVMVLCLINLVTLIVYSHKVVTDLVNDRNNNNLISVIPSSTLFDISSTIPLITFGSILLLPMLTIKSTTITRSMALSGQGLNIHTSTDEVSVRLLNQLGLGSWQGLFVILIFISFLALIAVTLSIRKRNSSLDLLHTTLNLMMLQLVYLIAFSIVLFYFTAASYRKIPYSQIDAGLIQYQYREYYPAFGFYLAISMVIGIGLINFLLGKSHTTVTKLYDLYPIINKT